MKRLICLVLMGSLIIAGADLSAKEKKNMNPEEIPEKVAKSNEEWKKELSPEEYHVCREKGTERAFTGKYWDNHEKGMYKCVACGLELFDADTKFDSGTGWPSFWEPVKKENVREDSDTTYGMRRTEVLCPRCGCHLGHVFNDGPKPTGLRYCINSASLKFDPDKKAP